ncbi:hypothetical protein H0W26_06200 [Candidatus Dependentiae bacterium]|nr:hypothetical protein [Candidatus Dependentiae bacterium]
MTFKKVSLMHAIAAAWDTYRKNALFFLTASLVGIFISLLFLALNKFLGINQFLYAPQPIVLGEFFNDANIFLPLLGSILMSIFSFLVYSLLNYQVLYASMAMYKGEAPSWKSFFVLPSRNFIRFFFAQSRFVLIGMLLGVLLLIPGLWYISSHYFAGYSILHSLTDSLKKDALMSRVITKDNRLRLLLLALINGLIMMPLSLIGLSYLIMPFILLVSLDMYNQLRESHNLALTVVPQ